ncbi:hypothetical protein ABZ816_18445 [Actinosynnema sp. NPDC047251]|uniref:Fe/B12 periplasmic-binding domain-containing protein n=1 Tax=Saccharothrix espanaensis (strain ATCC 51144 / DSM 44229 / JCM 9112 / NBRC 15066 / NRRL 15764) TaxID=1179773 RepID=K0K4Y2_SACES|nr:hypothetical protein [Saccharothrix espanaensis]CCH33361.1 hypothetical protein BN6_61080 [Saccharothrix espanaensis DSM 44229]
MTVEHEYGRTEVEAAPAKVVTLGLSDQDSVLALGVKPVGVVDWSKERPYGNWPWTKDLWGGAQPEIVGERGPSSTTGRHRHRGDRRSVPDVAAGP